MALMIGNCELPYLRVPVNQMGQSDLQAHVIKIVRSTVKGRHGYSEKKKPKWWPVNVPWCSPRNNGGMQWSKDLRRVIECCYTYYGLEDLLQGSPSSSPIRINGDSFQYCNGSGASPVPASGLIPSKLFVNLQEVQEGLIPSLAPVCERFEPLPESANISFANSGYARREKMFSTSFVELFICRFCEKDFGGRNQLKVHQECCSAKPSTEKGNTPVRSRWARVKPILPSPVPRPRWCTQPVHPDEQERAPISRFTESLELMPKSKLKAMTPKKDKVIDCERLDLDEEETTIPLSPTTPKSKLLLLRRDLSPSAKRSLSRSMSLSSHKLEVPLKLEEKREEDDGESANKETKGENNNNEGGKSETPEENNKLERQFAAARLLIIPITSVLGQRVRKHLETKAAMAKKSAAEDESATTTTTTSNNTTTNGTTKENEKMRGYEKYCFTPIDSEQYIRLRTRNAVEYPVTFNRKRWVSEYKCHKYKFSWNDRVEFWRTLKTGLNTRARRLERKTKKCEVRLTRLTERELRIWRLLALRQLRVIVKRLKRRDIAKWSRKADSNAMMPMMVNPSRFPSVPQYMPNTKVPICKRTLSFSGTHNSDLTQQVLNNLGKSKSEDTLTPPYTPQSQLSPSSTCSEPTLKPDADAPAGGATRKRRLSEPLTPQRERRLRSPCSHDDCLRVDPIVSMEPMVFYAGGKAAGDKRRKMGGSPVKKWDASGGVLVPLVGGSGFGSGGAGRRAEDFIVTLNGHESPDQHVASQKIVMFSPENASENIPKRGRPRKKDKLRNFLANNPHHTKKKKKVKVKAALAGTEQRKALSSTKSSGAKVKPVVKKKRAYNKKTPAVAPTGKKHSLGAKPTTVPKKTTKKLPAATKLKLKKKLAAQAAKKKARKMTEDSDDDDEVVLSDQSSPVGSLPRKRPKPKTSGVQGKKRKTGEAASAVVKKAKVESPSKGFPTKRPRSGSMIMFQCHLCGVELRAAVGEKDFIAEHYQQEHGVYNIRMRETVGPDGAMTVSIIKEVSTPKEKKPAVNGKVKPKKTSPKNPFGKVAKKKRRKKVKKTVVSPKATKDTQESKPAMSNDNTVETVSPEK